MATRIKSETETFFTSGSDRQMVVKLYMQAAKEVFEHFDRAEHEFEESLMEQCNDKSNPGLAAWARSELVEFRHRRTQYLQESDQKMPQGHLGPKSPEQQERSKSRGKLKFPSNTGGRTRLA